MQVAREMEMNRYEILGLSEMRWGGFGRVKLIMGETMLFSDRVDNLHRQGIGILMSKNATKALICWKPVNERIIMARFYSKYVTRHVLRMDHSSHCTSALTWTPEGTRKVGRPKTTWRRTVEKEREHLGWTS